MGGPTGQQKANEAAQAAFYTTMTQEQSQTFAENQDILAQVRSIETPILQAGPEQFGYSPAEWQDISSSIINKGAEASANAENAAQLRAKQAGGGTTTLGTGGQAELEENAQVLGEEATATNLGNAKLAGYQQGATNYSQALASLTGEQQIENPTSYGNTAVGAAGTENTAAENVYQAGSAIPMAILGGIAGGVSELPGAFGPNCWVARAVYGDDSPLWVAFRDKFFDGRFPVLNALYLRFGERFAKVVKRSPFLKAFLRPLMDGVIYA